MVQAIETTAVVIFVPSLACGLEVALAAANRTTIWFSQLAGGSRKKSYSLNIHGTWSQLRNAFLWAVQSNPALCGQGVLPTYRYTVQTEAVSMQ